MDGFPNGVFNTPENLLAYHNSQLTRWCAGRGLGPTRHASRMMAVLIDTHATDPQHHKKMTAAFGLEAR